MAEQSETPRRTPLAFAVKLVDPPRSQAVDPVAQPMKAPSGAEELARQRIAALDREARALGSDPSAAILLHEIGLLWEDPLKNPRNAAVAYQHAFRVAPKFIANIQAARRLFAEVGNWPMVVQLLDAELGATDDPARSAPLLFEKAVTLQTRLSDDEEARKAIRLCLEARPRHVPLLVQLEAHFAEADDLAALVEVYRLLTESIADDRLRAHYLGQAAEILQHRLQKPEEASHARRAAVALEKRDPLLLSAEIRSAEQEGRSDELLAALAAEAELLAEHAAPTYLRIAKVYERLQRWDEALAALLAARRVCPNEALVLSELSQIYEAQGRFEELADVLLSWAKCISDESEVVALNLRLAALYEDNLKRDDAAIERYRAILAQVPGHAGALAGLGKLYHRRQQWQQLVDVFDAEIASLEDPRQQAARMFKAAEILETSLGRTEDAIQRFSRCLHLQPGYLPAHKALTRLYSQLNKWTDLAALYEQDLLQTQDGDESVAILQKMASLYEERLQDAERASECLKRVLEIDPQNLPAIRNLAQLHEQARRWPELIALQQIEASLVRDTREVLSLHHKNAEIVEEELGDRSGAIAAWERLLSISPTYLPALQALGRLYAQEARWDDLIRMYRAEAEISPSVAQAAELIFKVGELQEQKLSDQDAAVASYQEVLTLAPAHFPALRALARIHRAQGAWESLIEVLHSQASNRADPVERTNALFQAAAIWEDRLERPDLAIEGYQEVLRVNPGHVPAIRALERLYASGSDVKEWVTILDRETQTAQTATARVAAYLKLAQLYLDRVREPARAAKCAEAALSIDPGQVSALKLLERVRAGDRVRRSELRARIAERVTDPKLRSALRHIAVADRDQPGADSGVDELFDAFMASPGDGRLAFQAERALRRSGDFARLAQVLEKQVKLASDPQEKAVLLLRAGDVYARIAARSHAAEAFEAALAIIPGCIAALQGLRAVQTELCDWAKVRATAEAEAAAARDPQTAIDAWVIAAEVARRRLDDTDGALAYYRKVLERDPLELRANGGIQEILESRGGAAELAALQEKRGEALVAQRNLPAAAGEFFAAAKAYSEKLKDPQKAWTALDRALAAQPTHPGGLELKAQIGIENGHFSDAAQALGLRVQQGGDAQRIAGFHLQLGALYQDRLSDLTRAVAHLQTSLAANPRCAEALERLSNIHTSACNWTSAVDCLKRLIELGGPPADLARRTASLARVLDEGMGDGSQATALYRRALELAPGDEAVIERLVQLYQKMGNLRALVDLLEQEAEKTRDPRQATQLRLKAAEIYAGPLANATKAVTHYRFVVEKEPGNVAAHAALAQLYMGDAAATPLAIEEHRHLLKLQPTRVESLHALFRLWESMKQSDKAFCAAGVLHFFHAANDVETAFYAQERNRLPQDPGTRLQPPEIDLLMHPKIRTSPLVPVLRAIGDQLGKLYPPNFEAAGIDRRTDRLKSDHPVHKAIRTAAQLFGVEGFEVFQASRGVMFLETGEPLAICVGQDVARKFNAREQKFLIAHTVFGLLNRTPVLQKLSVGDAADVLGNAVRIFLPEYAELGRPNDETVKQLRKALSRKSLKALETAAPAMASSKGVDLSKAMEWLSYSADRAGMVMCGDVGVGLSMLLREDPRRAPASPDATQTIAQAVQARADLQAAIAFAVSDEFFRLRQKLGFAL